MSSKQQVKKCGEPSSLQIHHFFALFVYMTRSARTKLSLLFLIPQVNLYPHSMKKDDHLLRHTHHQ